MENNTGMTTTSSPSPSDKSPKLLTAEGVEAKMPRFGHYDPTHHTLEDVFRDMEFMESEYRKFKHETYRRMRMFEEVFLDMRSVMRAYANKDISPK